MSTEWQWIARYVEQFEACAVGSGDVAVVLSESRSRPDVGIVSMRSTVLNQSGETVLTVVDTVMLKRRAPPG